MKSLKFEQVIIVFLIGVLFFKDCKGIKEGIGIYETEARIDTIYIKKVDTLRSDYEKLKYQKPKIVYVKEKSNTFERIEADEVKKLEVHEKEKLVQLNEFKDTLQNKDITIFSEILAEGRVFENKVTYEFNQPVIKELQINKVKIPQSGLFLYSTVGGNSEAFNTLNIGLQYVHRNKWIAGYSINTISSENISHNLTLGVKLF